MHSPPQWRHYITLLITAPTLPARRKRNLTCRLESVLLTTDCGTCDMYFQLLWTACPYSLFFSFHSLSFLSQSYIYLSTLLCYLSLRFFNLCYNDIYHDDKNNIYSAHLSDAICAGGWWVLAVWGKVVTRARHVSCHGETLSRCPLRREAAD